LLFELADTSPSFNILTHLLGLHTLNQYEFVLYVNIILPQLSNKNGEALAAVVSKKTGGLSVFLVNTPPSEATTTSLDLLVTLGVVCEKQVIVPRIKKIAKSLILLKTSIENNYLN
jgi:hypothetical protein